MERDGAAECRGSSALTCRIRAGTAQGFHIARPMPAADIEAWLAAGGFSLRLNDEDVERARPVDALHAVQLDVAGGGGA